MPDTPLTLMAVHAHPDDEATSTGGVLAKYAAEGVRTVLVTCTNGAMGDGTGGVKPGESGHDQAAVIALRRRELEESCRILGVQHLEMLGYRDSGMMGWESNDAPDSFWNMPVDEAAAPLVQLIDRYRPDVLLTYDEYGFYGHPDHIQAHRITVAAMDAVGTDAKLFYPTIRRSRLKDFRARMAETGEELPDVDEDQFGSPDEDIAATIDCRQYAPMKLAALKAHGSQGDNIFFLRFEMADFVEMFGTEEFRRARGDAVGPVPEDDLFAGLRSR
jgi:LmbE family N-acetylglucosaminyl deacetylase